VHALAAPSLCIDDNWIIIQNKVANGSVSFNRSWTDYLTGFGSMATDDNYWAGLETVSRLTSHTMYKLKVEVI